jgi:predicted ATPase
LLFLEKQANKSIAQPTYNKKTLEILTNFIQNSFIPQFRKEKEAMDFIKEFLIYSINTNSLRGLPSFQDSRKEPLGINGENLDILIANLSKTELEELKHYSYLVSWLETFKIDEDDTMRATGYKVNRSKSKLYFTDKFMMKKNNIFSSENSNEGILHILFYLALLISNRTPNFFAIDNIESSLNPHLCREMAKVICQLAKKNDKQVLITTHNPAILDGLDLYDEEVRLFEVSRNRSGHTKTRRLLFRKEDKPTQAKLSELWMRGYLGAISKNF